MWTIAQIFHSTFYFCQTICLSWPVLSTQIGSASSQAKDLSLHLSMESILAGHSRDWIFDAMMHEQYVLFKDICLSHMFSWPLSLLRKVSYIIWENREHLLSWPSFKPYSILFQFYFSGEKQSTNSFYFNRMQCGTKTQELCKQLGFYLWPFLQWCVNT